MLNFAKKSLIGASFLAFGGEGFSLDYQDISQDMPNYIASRFLGTQVSQHTTDDNTNKWGIGNIVEIDASGTIDSYEGAHGYADLTPVNSRYNGNYYIYDGNVVMSFLYSGWTEAEKYLMPSRSWIGYVWSDMHPKGRVRVALVGGGIEKAAKLEITYEALQDHHGDPGDAVRDVIDSMKHKFKRITEDFMATKGAHIRICIDRCED